MLSKTVGATAASKISSSKIYTIVVRRVHVLAYSSVDIIKYLPGLVVVVTFVLMVTIARVPIVVVTVEVLIAGNETRVETVVAVVEVPVVVVVEVVVLVFGMVMVLVSVVPNSPAAMFSKSCGLGGEFNTLNSFEYV